MYRLKLGVLGRIGEMTRSTWCKTVIIQRIISTNNPKSNEILKINNKNPKNCRDSTKISKIRLKKKRRRTGEEEIKKIKPNLPEGEAEKMK